MPYKGLSFEEWKKLVDAELVSRIGLDSDCLPDWRYYDSWKEGDSPKTAAKAAMAAASEF